MPHLLKDGLLWAVDALPDISNLILVLVGVIMSLPKLAEKIEDHAVARYSVAFGCIFLGLCGFVVSVSQRRSATAQMSTLVDNVNKLVVSTNTLVSSTNTDVTNTTTLVTTFGILTPQINSLNARVVDLDKKIEAAKGNPERIATLQAQAAALQEQSDAASRQVLLAMVPGVSEQLRDLQFQWERENETIIQQFYAAFARAKDKERELRSEQVRKRSDLDRSYSARIRPVLITADYLRQLLLNRLPPSDLTEQDKRVATMIADFFAGKTGGLIYPESVASYLTDLSKRVDAASSHQRALGTLPNFTGAHLPN